MSHHCPTVRVKSPDSPDGVKIINESDFDKDTHELADLPPPPASAPIKPPPSK